MSLSIRDQSQVRGFSAWSELNYFVYRKLSSWDAFFKWYHNRAKWNIFTVLAPAANTTNIDYEQSLIFLLLAVYDKQWSVSCEYTRPFILQPHQAPWWSQRTEHWPAWDANNESNVQVNSKTAHPPSGQSSGIWLALSSVQWGIWPKMRPARWGIWLSCQNVCQRSETKGFRNSLIVDTTRVFLLLSFLYRGMH